MLTNKEKYPYQAKASDQKCIEGDEEAKGCDEGQQEQYREVESGLVLTPPYILKEAFHTALECGSFRMQQMSHVVIQLVLLCRGPPFESNAMGQHSIVVLFFRKIGGDGDRAAYGRTLTVIFGRCGVGGSVNIGYLWYKGRITSKGISGSSVEQAS